MHVFQNFRNGEFRLAAVDHREDRVTPLDQLGDGRERKSGLSDSVRRYPPTADDPNDGSAIGLFLGREYVQGQRHAVLAAINDVSSAREWLVLLCSHCGGRENNHAGKRTDDRSRWAEKTAHSFWPWC